MGAALSGATAGLVLRYSLQLVDQMQGLLMSLTGTELGLVALERVSGFAKLKQETALENDFDRNLGAWPTKGQIEFKDVTMRYRDDLPRVLNGISFTIPGGTSVGVVGRTGAGKSSLIQALFRMSPLEGGEICIDGVDIWSLGLHTMRRRLAIIPQDPVGFSGSFRFNLDPFQECSDDALWEQLGRVQLDAFVRSKPEGLDFHLTSGGENLSVGQRQLACVARAFVRGSRILILDEATASVDFQTDELIQEVLRSEVTTNKLTTVTIAHRINTILGSDNVLVMERGVAAEFGPTQHLAKDPKSKFYSFVNAADGH
jgi:ABC-type multidrug transport system fused ATPase/permease subunit